jgi:hypothetical protein
VVFGGAREVPAEGVLVKAESLKNSRAAGSIRSKKGPGKRPRRKIKTARGPRMSRSRASRSEKLHFSLGFTGPKKIPLTR